MNPPPSPRQRHRTKHKHRKSPKRLIEVLLTLGWSGLLLGGIIMSVGVFFLDRFNRPEMLVSGLAFFLLSLTALVLGLLLKRKAHPDRTASPRRASAAQEPKRSRRQRQYVHARQES